MLDSDFWRDLADKFRRLDPDGILQAGWSLPFGPQSSELWQVVGTGDLGPSIQAQFEPLAIRAGLKLDKHSPHPVHVWLSALKAYGPQIDLIGPAGSMAQESGTIRKLCQISVDYCNQLEVDALQMEHASNAGIQILLPQWEPPIESKLQFPPSRAVLQPEAPACASPPQPDDLSHPFEAPPEPEMPPPTISTRPETQPHPPGGQHEPDLLPLPSEAKPQPEQAPSLHNGPSEGEKRRKLVNEFLRDCNKISDVHILRQHIWLSVGHSNRRQFEYWQRGHSKATDQDDRNFSRILRTPPEQFIALLRQQGRLK